MSIRVLLADDHTIVRDGIKYLLEEEENIKIIGEASNGQEALQFIKNNETDLLIIDVRMPKMNGIEAVGILNQTPTNTKSIVLSMHDSEEYILKSIEAGANGYLLKDTDKKEFIKAINTVYEGGKYFSGDISNVIVSNLLKKSTQKETTEPKKVIEEDFGLTKKEKQILPLILSGKTNAEISEILQNSKRTIETHRFNMMKKMNVKNLIELSSKAAQLELN
ncbi:response regulator transcription factor [uncultured Polaribacter sp.]|uniref:response regulator transcription factor n=1 Tax=uncultured Polaribacter sp. TaxID=174711 RepID=UPI00260D7697|nr:response regulator transcription factor [uncultured Polaribacter sp.]